ncbi:small ribosomal subunit protein mS77 (rPPR2)-like [Musa acuminata AAA Group]|uniref:small ribosomal subunit protein mS77 (rPPR2)-like n=1 Tax=Musa acuminata AAA Group TaxID=214697 RepID=UPI0031D01F4F
MREQAQKQEDRQKGAFLNSPTDARSVSLADEKGGASRVAAFPQRKGKFKYAIYGLDLSDPQMGGAGIKVAEAENHFVPQELQPVEEKCKEIEERILSLKAKRDDLPPLLADWKEFLQPKRIDWLALLDRIKERNVDLYLKVIYGSYQVKGLGFQMSIAWALYVLRQSLLRMQQSDIIELGW